ncbi:hypothetical protein [Hymenobacter fodinae]|uniref:Uncharacterized protein n=1 Tax=Hymenobacter fodinae TaxID=2510796 RepID=A0A4Z0P8F4_9BACT|nr:hypothetical protein [Hymenobacter fodinae]TGE08245.1 hypothetical protein EU556_11015 [Hymenobacter fodinae]
MKFLLLLLTCFALLTSCSTSRAIEQLQPTQAQLQSDTSQSSSRPGWLASLFQKKAPAVHVVALPAGAQLQLPKKMRNSSIAVTVQSGQGNIASVRQELEQDTKTKVSGSSSYARDSGTAVSARKSQGVAVGPNATASPQIEQSSSGPWWAHVLFIVLGFVGGFLIHEYAGKWLRSLPFLGALLLLLACSATAQARRYSYKEANRTERITERNRDKYRRVYRRALRQLQRERRRNQQYFRRHKQQHPISFAPFPQL